MDYGKILARAFEITYKYRGLWLFGVLLALFGGSGNFNPANFGNGANGSRPGGNGDFGNRMPNLPSNFGQYIVAIVVALVCIMLILIVLSLIARLVSRGALIGLVQELEANGTTPTVRRGFSIGASRFWPLLGIAVGVNLPITIFSFIIVLTAIAPLLVTLIPALSRNPRSNDFFGLLAGGIFGSLAMICCAVLCLGAIALIVRPFYEFIVRRCVIEKRGVIDSVREGIRMVRANLGNVAVLYVLVIGIGIGYGILMIPVSLLLIGFPVILGIGVGVAANAWLPGVVVGGLVAIPFLLGLIFISGLYQIFESTVWTEGYLAVGQRSPLTAPVSAPNPPTL